MSACPFAVVETRWWSVGNHSVRALFEAVASIHYDNPSAFYYDMFNSKGSLKKVVDTRAKDGATEVIYLASHGNETHFGPDEDSLISRSEFRNMLRAANIDATIKGIYFGTCLTGNTDVARFFLQDTSTKIEWIAGYSESVDWIEGTAIDMVFFSRLVENYEKNKKRRGNSKKSARGMAHEAATELLALIPSAHSKFGFNIFFHEGGKLTSMFAVPGVEGSSL